MESCGFTRALPSRMSDSHSYKSVASSSKPSRSPLARISGVMSRLVEQISSGWDITGEDVKLVGEY